MTATKTKIISATLSGDWKQAISLNLELLKENSKDTEALNRLAFAYCAQGKIKEAKLTYQKVLKIDKLNPIANKNIKKLDEGGARKQSVRSYTIDNAMFLEEVGKTKIITLINTAPPKKLRGLAVGQQLVLHIKRLKIFTLDENEDFIGMLPDNVSTRLIKFIKGGNKYAAYVRSVDDHGITAFVKEVKRVSKFKNQPSFVVNDAKTTLVISKKKSYAADDSDSDDETSEE